jgi:hypothetical protein
MNLIADMDAVNIVIPQYYRESVAGHLVDMKTDADIPYVKWHRICIHPIPSSYSNHPRLQNLLQCKCCVNSCYAVLFRK